MARIVSLITIAVHALCAALAISTPLHAQAVAASNWTSNYPRIAQLTVAIDPGAATECIGGGIVIGYDNSRAYAVTSQRLLAEAARDPARPPKFHVSVRNGAGASLQRVPTTVLHEDADKNLAVLEIADTQAIAALKNARFDVLGAAPSLVRTDPVSGVGGCAGLDRTPLPARPLLGFVKTNQSFVFQGTDLKPEHAGGPLVHLIGAHPTIVGLLLVARERTVAKSIDVVLEAMRAWKVPVNLTAPGTRSGCTYTYNVTRATDAAGVTRTKPGDKSIFLMSTSKYPVTIGVETSPACPWTAYTDASPWMGMTPAGGARTGPGSITLNTTQGNMCEGRTRIGTIYVAGYVLSVSQDGTAMGMNCE